MKFTVEPWNGRGRPVTTFPHVILVQDNWDDYGYRTTFRGVLHLDASQHVDLGTLKIMADGQTGGFTELPSEPFESLGSGFCSLGGNLDYYEVLMKLGRDIYHPYLTGLNDAAYSDDLRARYEDTEGFKVSLLRFSGSQRTIASARSLFAPVRGRKPGSGMLIKLKTRVAEDANGFTVHFDFRRKKGLPHRVNALIGYNGTGKTRLLSNLAMVASGYGYSSREDAAQQVAGRFVDPPPLLKKVVVISYSAFDTFAIPGQTDAERERLVEKGDLFGYAYCGLREIGEADPSGGTAYRLQTPEETRQAFVAALRRVQLADREWVLFEVLRPLLLDASFQRIGLTSFLGDFDDLRLLLLFDGLSSGHKIVLKILTDLTAHMDRTGPTLVLVDEPETHLHPPLLAALLKSMRHCLDILNGYAVVATHSPVVLQETPGRFVQVMRRVGSRTIVEPTTLETFGESIGLITQDVFNLDEDDTDWHGTLRELVTEGRTLEEIEGLFGRRLGFAARSYVAGIKGDEQV